MTKIIVIKCNINDIKIFKKYYLDSYGEDLTTLVHADIKMYCSYMIKIGRSVHTINRAIAAIKQYNLFLIDQKLQQDIVIIDKDYIKVQKSIVQKVLPTEQELNKLKHSACRNNKNSKRDFCLIAKDKSIQILHFATLNQISPTYFDKTYYAVPEAGGEKAFELLRSALLDEQKIAIGKTVMRDKENLIAIIPRNDGMLIQTMLFQDDIKELPKSYEKPAISHEELQMAKTLVNSMNTPFDPNIYKDEYQEKLKNLIETKIQGKEVQNQEENQTTIINLMEALKQSIEKERVNV